METVRWSKVRISALRPFDSPPRTKTTLGGNSSDFLTKEKTLSFNVRQEKYELTSFEKCSSYFFGRVQSGESCALRILAKPYISYLAELVSYEKNYCFCAYRRKVVSAAVKLLFPLQL